MKITYLHSGKYMEITYLHSGKYMKIISPLW